MDSEVPDPVRRCPRGPDWHGHPEGWVGVALFLATVVFFFFVEDLLNMDLDKIGPWLIIVMFASIVLGLAGLRHKNPKAMSEYWDPD